MMRPIRDYASQWEQNAQIDAMCAVLTVADKQNRGWELERFLSTGEDEISRPHRTHRPS